MKKLCIVTLLAILLSMAVAFSFAEAPDTAASGEDDYEYTFLKIEDLDIIFVLPNDMNATENNGTITEEGFPYFSYASNDGNVLVEFYGSDMKELSEAQEYMKGLIGDQIPCTELTINGLDAILYNFYTTDENTRYYTVAFVRNEQNDIFEYWELSADEARDGQLVSGIFPSSSIDITSDEAGTDTADTAAGATETGTDAADTAADTAEAGTDAASTTADTTESVTDTAETTETGMVAADTAANTTEADTAAANTADTDADASDTAPAESEAVEGICIADMINIRLEPSMDARSIGRINKRQKLTVLENDGEWSKISCSKGEGYIKSQYIFIPPTSSENESYAGICNADKVNIRELPTANSPSISQIYRGQELTVLGNDGDWSLISCPKGEGYIRTQYINFIEK